MAKKIKKWKLLSLYIDTLKKHTNDIRNHFIENSHKFTYQIKDMNYDRVYRFYTVINFPPNTTENIQKYGYRYMDNETKKFITELNGQFQKYGINELVGLAQADQIKGAPQSILIVVKFKYLNTTKIARNIILYSILGLLALVGIFFIFI